MHVVPACMKISIRWLADFIPSLRPSSSEVARLANCLTMAGLEVEAISPHPPMDRAYLDQFLLGEVLDSTPCQQADRLRLLTVDVGKGERKSIVCGASNAAVGQRVIVALPGTELLSWGGESLRIKETTIRGNRSQGMLCAAYELGVGADQTGIIVVETPLPSGTPAGSCYLEARGDTILEIAVTPDRGDVLSHYGVARDLSACLGYALCLPKVLHAETPIVPVAKESPVSVSVEDNACLRYTGCDLWGVEVKASPQWLQERLAVVGVRAVNNVVDVGNYVMHAVGQPLHLFDRDKILQDHLTIRKARDGETINTLDGKERILLSSDLLIGDARRPLCIAGVMGGAEAMVSSDTKNIFIECASFSPQAIAKTARHHSIQTEASYRYERGVDATATYRVLRWTLSLLQSMAGGVVGTPVDHYPSKLKPRVIRLYLSEIPRYFGVEIPRATVKVLLDRLEMAVQAENNTSLWVEVPVYRQGIVQPIDLVANIVRLYGYDKAAAPAGTLVAKQCRMPLSLRKNLKERVSQWLVSLGFYEMITSSLVPLNWRRYEPRKDTCALVREPASKEMAMLRPQMAYAGLQSLAHNIRHKQVGLKFFEFGKVYYTVHDNSSAAMGGTSAYAEPRQLAIYLSGAPIEQNWRTPATSTSFYDLSGVVERLLVLLCPARAYQRLTHTPLERHPLFAYGLSLGHGEKTVVQLGLLHTSLLQEVAIEQPVWHAVIFWDTLVQWHAQEGRLQPYQPMITFPAVYRELSLVLDESTSYHQLTVLMLEKKHPYIRSWRLLNIYRDKSLGPRKKSYTVQFILQANKTLTYQEINRTMDELIKLFARELQSIVRT